MRRIFTGACAVALMLTLTGALTGCTPTRTLTGTDFADFKAYPGDYPAGSEYFVHADFRYGTNTICRPYDSAGKNINANLDLNELDQRRLKASPIADGTKIRVRWYLDATTTSKAVATIRCTGTLKMDFVVNGPTATIGSKTFTAWTYRP